MKNKIVNKINKFLKCENKGNTLGIVIIGIFLLAILGGLIMNITVSNYQTKVVDRKSKDSFYYVEKAVDEIYAGLGVEVMDSMSKAYKSVLAGLIKLDGSDYKSLTNEEANAKFKQEYLDELKVTFSDDVTKVDDIMNSLGLYVEIPPSDVSISVEAVASTSIVYEVNKIRLHDVCVKSETTGGYYASVTTDFVISVPNVQVDFTDSSSRDYGELFSYAFVADGNETLVSNPAVTVGQNYFAAGNKYFDTNITGNMYAGSDSTGRKNSIELNPNVKLNVSSKNVVNAGSFVLNDSNATLKGISGKKLQLWAKNIRTIGSLGDELNIEGDCVIGDDLEVNGTNSNISIIGNYYGYGYDYDAADEKIEAISNENTLLEGDSTATTFEHEKRSAIVINGRGANVNLRGLDTLILGGRAYIDLEDGGSIANATYMTGESVSIKGNQQVYLADLDELGNIVYANPVPYSFLSSYISGGTLDYTTLGLSGIIGKKVGTNSVYFYKQQIDPKLQTDYFLNKFENSMATRNSMKEQVSKLDVKNLLLGSNTKSYTVGAITQVENGNLIVPGNYKLTSGENGITQDNFVSIVADAKFRYRYISSELKDYSDEYELGKEVVNTTVQPTNTKPYNYYIDETEIVNIGTYFAEDLQNTIPNASSVLSPLGITSADNVAILIDDNKSRNEVINVNSFHNGVIICTGDVKVAGDFKGIIICGGDLYFNGVGSKEQDIKACKELAAFLADNDAKLGDVLDGYIAGSVTTGSMLEMEDITYKDLIVKENWRKNEN